MKRSLTFFGFLLLLGIAGGIAAAGDAATDGIEANAPPRRFAYVHNARTATVSQYAVGDDGTLTPLIPSVVPSGRSQIAEVAIHPGRKAAYVADPDSKAVWQYALSPGGTLSPLKPATAPAGSGAVTGLTFSADGRYAYLANAADGTISRYAVDGEYALSLLQSVRLAGAPHPESLYMHPGGTFAYVIDAGGAVAPLAVDAHGMLTELPPPPATGGRARSLAFGAGGKFVYVSNGDSETVGQYRVEADGTLAPLSPASVETGDAVGPPVVNPTGRFAYLCSLDGASHVYQYAVAADGALSPLAPPTVSAGAFGLQITLDPRGRTAYVADLDGDSLLQYRIGPNGALQPFTPAQVGAGRGPRRVTVDPTGRFAYVVNSRGGSISQYRIGDDGSLSPLSPALVGTGEGADFITIVEIPGR